ncbi:TIGR01621 family pseudouridine synthase [Rheinheimera tangshanensis]|uniref:TIGR01621 family pseudouridine synthase n=1 Tax=Rheinheimera tangshanensis TaxID=400153 RepID=A0A5C8LNN3_9GAMM|nr:TIGR01621 family pseudouridine synthase [Rheinheimera tangshanensis]TXK78197.1 TIGR01621 family pseudouridine synthase [Rheinheimera tangshanensis]GGM71294.1 RNA pseudouridine synthase [Rheinheimera tangshanensis]
MTLKLVFEHTDFLVLDKPSGISFHSEFEPGVVALAEAQFGLKLYAVHRLDKGTSGLLLLAKSSEAAAKLAELFQSQQIQKFYLALTDQKPKKKQGWVKGDMVQARRSAWKLISTLSNPAISYFVSAFYEVEGRRVFLVKPFTGKTHQVRVALKSVSAAILGDALYQGSAADRLYLHAYALYFSWDGAQIKLVLPPSDGTEFLSPSLVQHLNQHWAEPVLLDWPSYQKPTTSKVVE